MTALQLTLAVGSGGFLGAVIRFWICAGVTKLFGEDYAFWGTATVNTLGCLAIGLATAGIQRSANVPPWIQKSLVTGLLGAFTTFSTFGLDTVLLAQTGRISTAIISILFQVIVGLALVWLGLQMGLKWIAVESVS